LETYFAQQHHITARICGQTPGYSIENFSVWPAAKARPAGQSARRFAALITRAHFAVSAYIKVPNLSGELPTGSAPCATDRGSPAILSAV
jgi:hypothetical protein